jgi:hypothetical protein
MFLPAVSAPFGIQVSLAGIAFAIVRGQAGAQGQIPQEQVVFMVAFSFLVISSILGFFSAVGFNSSVASSLELGIGYKYTPGILALVAVGFLANFMLRAFAQMPPADPTVGILVGPGWGLGVLALGGILLVVAPFLPQ